MKGIQNCLVLLHGSHSLMRSLGHWTFGGVFWFLFPFLIIFLCFIVTFPSGLEQNAFVERFKRRT